MRQYRIEKEGQIDFFKTFRIDYENNNVLIENTDGVWNGNLLEFKLNITDVSKTLLQAIKYLSKLRVKGISVPANILLISLNERICYIFKSQDYFDDIHKIYYGPASKNNDGFIITKSYVKIIDYSKQYGQAEMIQILRIKNHMPINIDENCIVGWAERYYNENPNAHKGDFLGDLEGLIKIIGEIRQPKHFEGHILPYKGKTNEKFKYLMDKLNDDLNKKNLGAFYTPKLYCEKAAELLRKAIERVPKGNDYIIIDRCAGTGNLEAILTDEELSHCILSTYEYYEYKVLCERLSDKVRFIIPPIETDETYDKGFVKNANALSKDYVYNELIQKYIKDNKCTIILFENPPYAETTSIEHQKKSKSKTSSIWKKSFVVEEMKKEVKGVATNDLGNAFIWSAFKYYLRQTTDSYIVFSPVKYWKVQHLISKKLLDGYAFNRKHFHTSINACIMVALWTNEDCLTQLSFVLKAYDIKDNELVCCDNLDVKKIFTKYSNIYYDKRKLTTETETGILVGLNGLEAPNNVKKSLKPLYDENIIGYLVADSSGFDNPDNVSSLLIAGRYNGHGFFLRKDNYLEKLPIFAASRYIRYNTSWTERTRVMKSADGSERFFKHIATSKGKQDLLKILLFCTLESQNHMRSFIGSNGIFYKNEICLDTTNGETIVSMDLNNLKVNDTEKTLIDLWNKILYKAKLTSNYNAELTYGIYQIKDELNTHHKNELGETVYDYPMLNGDISTLTSLVKCYYLKEIVPFLFKYEFLK
ncbi:hypothetical protein [Clostridium celatum]|uniref:Uncharacterized protein n=1 Tax=Clostridium celatum DSM 1785 TaxID=545697 RepID=L1QIR6_9CLOT|nr:hypothetical protein [Clostridium celatum]EKY27853.1 hypothetical protein HMPREF0216_01143 [Clostridium celatum DSM 1785]MCE9656775.1 hypothetical protein [Clostridium celatum]